MKALKLTIATLTLLNYVFLAVFGLLAMNYVHTHDASSMEHCPFMQGQQSLCSMSLTDHVNAFYRTIQATLGQVAAVALPALFALFMLVLRLSSPLAWKTSSPRQDFFSLLFSQGILHPKAP